MTLIVAICAGTEPAHGVVGGQPVPEASVPWFVSLWGCGGTLVSPDRVLTAGHCVRGLSLAELDHISVAGTVRSAVRVAMHPGWRRRNGGSPLEDLALIRLDRPVLGVPPVALGGPLPDRATIIGRGRTAPYGHVGGEGELLGAELRFITNSQCARAYRRRRGSRG